MTDIAEAAEVRLRVDGMDCGACATKIEICS
jgi:copper chaperone CopZ